MSVNGFRPYPAYRESGLDWLGEVPEHWELRRTKALLKQRSEKEFPNEPLLAATQTKGVVRKEQYENRTVLALKDLHLLKLVRVGDFVISLRSFQGGIEYARERGIISPAYTVLFPVRPDDHGYLAHLFKSAPYVENLSLFVTGIRQGQNIDYARLARSRLPLPPLSEQRAIVRYLDRADRRIRRYIRAKERLIELLEERKRALIHEAVTGRFDVRTGQPYPAYKDSGVEWLGKVPEHWERRRLKTILRVIDRRSCTGEETLLSLRRDHGVVVYSEHFARPPQGRTLVGYKQLAVGQLVVNRLQANNGLVFCSGVDGLVSPDYSVFDKMAPLQMKYLSDLLRTSAYRSHFRRVSTGLGTGTAGFLRLYDDVFLSTTVFLPPDHEQVSVLEYVAIQVRRIEGLIASAERGLDLLDEYRTRLIADVVTGKLDVREAAARLPETEPLADDRDRTDTIDTESHPHATEYEAAKEAYA